MNVAFLELRREVEETRGELDRALAGVLDGGRFVLGEAVDAFEEAFAASCGAAHAVGVASGTDALTIALRAVGVEPGDEVITAANTCIPTVAAIEAAGAVPVLADADPLTQTLDPASVAAVLGERTRAIVPVHLYGQCADMEAIGALARAHDLRVVEDAAQAHGAEHRGRRAGTVADAAAFSFYPTKNLGALGDGGAVVTGDPAVAERARRLRVYGEHAGEGSVVPGWNSRLDAIQAAALLTKLPKLDRWNERRREIASFYAAALAGSGLVLPVEAAERRHVYHLFVVRTREREAFRERLRAQGVETAVHYPRAVHEHPAYRWLGQAGGRLGESERLAREVVSLPLYPQLTDAEVEAVGCAAACAARSST